MKITLYHLGVTKCNHFTDIHTVTFLVTQLPRYNVHLYLMRHNPAPRHTSSWLSGTVNAPHLFLNRSGESLKVTERCLHWGAKLPKYYWYNIFVTRQMPQSNLSHSAAMTQQTIHRWMSLIGPKLWSIERRAGRSGGGQDGCYWFLAFWSILGNVYSIRRYWIRDDTGNRFSLLIATLQQCLD